MDQYALNPNARDLEEEFFANENRRLLERLREKREREARREALREVMPNADDAFIDHMLELEIGPETVLAVVLLPLAMVAWAESGRDWPRIGSDHPAYFYSLRASDTPDRDLVNMLLAELSPLDFRQLFICHKEAFYRRYRTWTDAKRAHVCDVLEQEYVVDKAGARAALFGHEPDMSGRTPEAVSDRMIRRVGPWGAVRKL